MRDRDYWASIIYSGRFSAVPKDLAWNPDGRNIASLLNGYKVAETMGFNLPDRYHRRMGQNSFHEADLPELWALMFFKARSDHFSVLPAGMVIKEDPVEAAVTNTMCSRFASLCHEIAEEEFGFLREFFLER